jgi:glutamate 5-kinase
MRKGIAQAKRIVIKVGTSTLTYANAQFPGIPCCQYSCGTKTISRESGECVPQL